MPTASPPLKSPTTFMITRASTAASPARLQRRAHRGRHGVVHTISWVAARRSTRFLKAADWMIRPRRVELAALALLGALLSTRGHSHPEDELCPPNELPSEFCLSLLLAP